MADSDAKLTITADEAIGLLVDDAEYVHNYISGRGIMLGCDFSREGAIEAFRKAHSIEIGGPACKASRHPIAVWDSPNHVSFFEADMAKVEAFEASRAIPA